jgi:hypothetical protein
MLRPRSVYGNDSPPKSTLEEFHKEDFLPQSNFFAKRHARQYADAGKADASFSQPLRRLSFTTSGFLCLGQPEKGLDEMVRPVQRPSRRPSLNSSTNGRSSLSASASDGALLSRTSSKRRSSKGGTNGLPSSLPQKQDSDPRVGDPFECKWMEVDVLKTVAGDQILKEDFLMVFDMYQTLDSDGSFSNSRYKQMCKSEIGRRAMQVCQSVKMRLIRSGLSTRKSKCLIISLEDFLKQVWPHLSSSEEDILMHWATQRERQLYAIHRLVKSALPTSIFK